MTIAERLWDKHYTNDDKYDLMFKDDFKQAIEEAMRLQRDACAERFYKFVIDNDLERVNTIEEAILNAKVQDE